MTVGKVGGILFAVFVGTGLLLVSCKGKGETEGPGAFPRGKTLYISGFLWGPPSTFNPLAEDPAFPNSGNCNLVYESLFGYNSLTGELEGILAKEYMISEGVLTVLLNENARWHNGDPVTADDVLYTFALHKKYPTTMESHWQYIAEMKAEDAQTITFTLSEKKYNPLTMKDIISSTYILPQKVYEEHEKKAIASLKVKNKAVKIDPGAILEKMRAYTDDKPVGSGPYTIYEYSDQQVVLKRVDTYWGKIMHDGALPPPAYIIHPIYKSNDAGNLALVQGKLDLSQNFIPQIWNKFSKGVGTWYPKRPYYIAGTIPCMVMYLLDAPFNDVNFRRAVAYAVNYSQILDLSIYGYAPPLQPGLILPFDTEEQYFNKKDAKEYGVTYDPDKARKILTDAGYTWGADSMLVDPKGNKVRTLYAVCPNGWSDWESTVRIFVSGLRAIGIDVREKFPEWTEYWQDFINGNFDFTMFTPLAYQAPSLPWARFNWVMSSEEWKPKNEPMWSNMGRYKNSEADSLLTILPKLMDDEEIKNTYRVLNVKFMKELPVIPLMYRPWFFYEFSTKNWNNFPTSENPYAPPQCCVVGAGIKALWQLKPVGR